MVRQGLIGVVFLFAVVTAESACSSDDSAAQKGADAGREAGCAVVNNTCVADEGATCCSISATPYDAENHCVRSAAQVVDCWKVENPCLPNAAAGCFSRLNDDGSRDTFLTPSTYAGFSEHTGTIGAPCDPPLANEVIGAPACGG